MRIKWTLEDSLSSPASPVEIEGSKPKYSCPLNPCKYVKSVKSGEVPQETEVGRDNGL